jgi:hypothetical protein
LYDWYLLVVDLNHSIFLNSFPSLVISFVVSIGLARGRGVSSYTLWPCHTPYYDFARVTALAQGDVTEICHGISKEAQGLLFLGF